MLKDMLEKILFDENRLEALKHVIMDLQEGSLDSKAFRQVIFSQRQQMFEELLEFFPFYVKHQHASRNIEEFTSSKADEHGSGNEREKDAFLVEIYQRLKSLRERCT